MDGLTRGYNQLRRIFRFRHEIPPGLEKEFVEYKDINSIDRIRVAAWIGFFLSLLLFPLDFKRMDSGTFYSAENPTYRYLFYFHVFGLIFLLPAWSMTFHKQWVISSKLRRGLHIWGMVVLSYIFLFGMAIVVFWDRDGLIIFMAFIFISSWMFAMSHKERLLFILTTLPPMALIIILKPADMVSYDKIAMFYEITFLSVVAFIFDTFDYNLKVSNFLALKKNMEEEYENKVEALMMQKFTSIHPSIQWRFRQEAINWLNNKSNQNNIPDIRFENVYPFYGSLDIRNSSSKRRQAIAQDLLLSLDSAYKFISEAYNLLALDILGELTSEIEKYMNKIKSSFSSGDEEGIATFIRKKINPVVDHLKHHYPQLEKSVNDYTEIASETGIRTKHRVAYEEALSTINNCIVHCLEEEERNLQRLHPCYFEKYKTDGLEYNIYAGASITNGQPLDPLYMDNLRLRQLLWTCTIMKKVHELNPGFNLNTVPLSVDRTETPIHDDSMEFQITPLILAYTTPITLKFRLDEKRLDVDGSSSIRFEMLKKRIDKAIVSGTQNRLTQPGTISIVYTQDQEVLDYEKHLHYMVEKNLVKPGWERLDLENMQGVDGLKALRIQVIIS